MSFASPFEFGRCGHCGNLEVIVKSCMYCSKPTCDNCKYCTNETDWGWILFKFDKDFPKFREIFRTQNKAVLNAVELSGNEKIAYSRDPTRLYIGDYTVEGRKFKD